MARPFDDFRLSYVQERLEPPFTILTVVSGSEFYQQFYQRLKNAFDSNSPFLHNGQSFWIMTMRSYGRGMLDIRMIDCDLVHIVPRTHCSVDKVVPAPQPPPVDSATFKQMVKDKYDQMAKDQMVKDVYDRIRDMSISPPPPLTPAQQAAQRAMMQPQQKRVGLLGLDSTCD